jgi:2-polyprenyl-6-methoxyphenol hydroxylase-like FAD-dependent oxidoreductase
LLILPPRVEAVTVEFGDRSTEEYDLVVGADGLRSTVRKLAVSAESPQNAGTMAWRSVGRTRPRGLDGLRLMPGEGHFFGLVPVGDGGTYGFAGLVSDRMQDPAEALLDRFREHFADFGGLVPAYLDSLIAADPLHVGAVTWISLERWHAGRVVIIGDVAHAAPPYMGEGGSLAAEDALVLAQELRKADTIQTALHGVRGPAASTRRVGSGAKPRRGPSVGASSRRT